MSDRLLVPSSSRPEMKLRDGLYVGAVVLVANSGQGATGEDGHELPLTALVIRVYPDDETATDRFGQTKPWAGVRPFIDAFAVVTNPATQQGEPVRITKIPWFEDVQRIMALQGVPKTRPFPGYRVVAKMEGIR